MTANQETTTNDYSCTGCKFDIPGDCSNRHIGDDGYMHFPEGHCWTAFLLPTEELTTPIVIDEQPE